MLQTILENVVESYRAPRNAARRIATMVRRPEEVALLFGLSFCVSALLLILTQFLFGTDGDAGGLSFVFTNFLIGAASFTILSGLVFWVGRLFGGQGGLMEVAAVIAWHSLVTSIFTPFIAGAAAPGETPGPAFLIQVGLVGLTLWLLVNFITEVHRFQSAWRVAGVMLAGMFMAGLILPILLAGLI